MKFLIDTNVFIPLEPIAGRSLDAWTEAAASFSRAATGTGQQIFVHPAARKDIEHIRQDDLKILRSIQFERYAELPDPPSSDDAINEVLGQPEVGGNDWVDDQLLVAVAKDAVDYLVTGDGDIHRKATKLGIADRVVRLGVATELINQFVPRTKRPPPLVHATKVHALRRGDDIFSSLREDYPEFNDWLSRIAREHRDAWFIENADEEYAAIAIVKVNDPSAGHLKLCTFKIADGDHGKKYGELMLRQVFQHCRVNKMVRCNVSVFPKHAALVALLQLFGFQDSTRRTERGEHIYEKSLEPDGRHVDDALAFHVAFGPHHVWRGAPAHVVPIQPRYDAILFPGNETQLSLLRQDQPFGNAILKAYLCHAVSRQLRPGHTLFFYRSQDEQGMRNVGVVEDTLVSGNASEIARFVGLRTVYPLADIEAMCAFRPVLAIKFRHARTLDKWIKLEALNADEILKGYPQSIQILTAGARDALWDRIDELDG